MYLEGPPLSQCRTQLTGQVAVPVHLHYPSLLVLRLHRKIRKRTADNTSNLAHIQTFKLVSTEWEVVGLYSVLSPLDYQTGKMGLTCAVLRAICDGAVNICDMFVRSTILCSDHFMLLLFWDTRDDKPNSNQQDMYCECTAYWGMFVHTLLG